MTPLFHGKQRRYDLLATLRIACSLSRAADGAASEALPKDRQQLSPLQRVDPDKCRVSKPPRCPCCRPSFARLSPRDRSLALA
jgi:hypothetical protein